MTGNFITIALLILTVSSFGQLPKKVMKKMGLYPVIFIDSVETDSDSLRKIDPLAISNIDIVKPKTAKKLIGDRGVDGAIYVTTIIKAKTIYWAFFKTKSAEYSQLLNSPQSDTIVQYVLNGEVWSEHAAPGRLFLIANKKFKKLKVIDNYKSGNDSVISKRYIVSISAKRPKGIVKTSGTSN